MSSRISEKYTALLVFTISLLALTSWACSWFPLYWSQRDFGSAPEEVDSEDVAELEVAGFLRKDMTPKLAYEELHKLIKGAWWTRLAVATGDDGTATARGFLGDYRVRVLAPGKPPVVERFTLAKGGPNRWTVRLP